MKKIFAVVTIVLLVFGIYMFAQFGYLQRPQKLSIKDIDSIRVVEKWDIEIKIDKVLTEEERIHLIQEIENNKFYNRPITTYGPEIASANRYVYTFYSNSVEKYSVYVNWDNQFRFYDGENYYYSRKDFNFETLELE